VKNIKIALVSVYAAGYLIVTVPSADIRKVPQDKKPGYSHDNLQETQALFNEVLLDKFSKGDWYCVEAIEQKEFTHGNKWQGYPGYIRKESVRSISDIPDYDLVVNSCAAEVLDTPSQAGQVLFKASLGTRFRMTDGVEDFYEVETGKESFGWINKKDVFFTRETFSEDEIRENIVKAAKACLNIQYLWGGRDSAKGIDCSGLTNLAYRASNINIPRDAHEQWMVADKITPDELKPADLIFLSGKNSPDSIVHVMLFIGKEEFVEAPGTGKAVRIASFTDKFGENLEGLKRQGFITGSGKIYFGRIEFPQKTP
jgi:cell wall-associated NlpC family hydrolase